MGPRRSRADRDRGRLERAAARRELAVQKAALRRAAADVGADGRARLVVTAGRFAPARRHGRVHLDAAPQPAPVVWLPWPMALPSARPATVTALPDGADIQTALAAYLDRHAPVMAAPEVADDDRPDVAVIGRTEGAHPAATTAAMAAPAEVARPVLNQGDNRVKVRPDVATMHSAERGEAGGSPDRPVNNRLVSPTNYASSDDAAAEPLAEPVTALPAAVPEVAAEIKDDRPVARPETARRRPKSGHRRGHDRPSDGPKQAAIRALRDQPDMDTDALAAAIGRSPRTARRIRSELAMANGHGGQEGG
jgi:hypothetical protein